MHDRCGMMFAPLRESKGLAVEVPQQYRHTHGNVLHREAAALRVRDGANAISHVRMDDENGGFVASRLGKLRRISDIHQALRQRLFRNVAMRGRDFQIPLKKCKDVRVMILDGLSA